jgi:hypothetical protein
MEGLARNGAAFKTNPSMVAVALLLVNKNALVCGGKLGSLSRFRNIGMIGGAIEIKHFMDRTRLRETQRQLEGIYQQRHMMEPQVQALLQDSPEDHVQQSVTKTRNWIFTNRRLFRQSVRRVKASALRGVRSFRTYFQPGKGG